MIMRSLTILFLLLNISSLAQQVMNIEKTVLVGQDRGIYEYRNFVVDSNGNKYVFAPYLGNVSIG
jgi:hypothetical protein